jgi:hypothetical protein
MAVAVQNSGTLSTVVGTESTVDQVNIGGVFSFHVDLNAMAAGDIVELRAYQMVLSGGSSRVLLYQAYYGVQPTDDLVKMSFPIGNDLTDSTALQFSIKQTFGTSRSVPWKVLKYS